MQSVDSEALQVGRVEKKYLVNYPAEYVMAPLSHLLRPDVHAGTGGYIVRSLYFDSVFDDDLFSSIEGLECRRKLRLRAYGPDFSFVKLELKQKRGARQHKLSLPLSQGEALLAARGDFSFLPEKPGEEAVQLYAELCRGYRPTVIVEYDRLALCDPYSDLRVTLDSRIRATEPTIEPFARQLPFVPALEPGLAVLEVKYSRALPRHIADEIKKCRSFETAASKYAAARALQYEY